jgi:DNA adenine methylase
LWETILEELPRIAVRLSGVRIEQSDALDLIRRHDGSETLFFLVPPYLHQSRTAHQAYAHEMTDHEHVRLLLLITSVRGMVVLSGYLSPLYYRALASWERHEFELPNHSGQGRIKHRRTEVLWLNPAGERFALS